MARPERFELPTLCFKGGGDLKPIRVFAVEAGTRYTIPLFQHSSISSQCYQRHKFSRQNAFRFRCCQFISAWRSVPGHRDEPVDRPWEIRSERPADVIGPCSSVPQNHRLNLRPATALAARMPLTHATIVVYMWQHSENAYEHLPSPRPSETLEGHWQKNRVFIRRTSPTGSRCVLGEGSGKEEVRNGTPRYYEHRSIGTSFATAQCHDE